MLLENGCCDQENTKDTPIEYPKIMHLNKRRLKSQFKLHNENLHLQTYKQHKYMNLQLHLIIERSNVEIAGQNGGVGKVELSCSVLGRL